MPAWESGRTENEDHGFGVERQNGARDFRIVGVNPGPVDTDRIYNMLKKRSKDWFGTEDRYKELQDRYPLKRPAHVHEVTDLIVFLASHRSGYTSGTIFTVDGGIASRRSVI